MLFGKIKMFVTLKTENSNMRTIKGAPANFRGRTARVDYPDYLTTCLLILLSLPAYRAGQQCFITYRCAKITRVLSTVEY